MNKSRLLGVVCAIIFSFATVSANAALVSRLGGQAAYDTVLDITWLTNAGLSGAANWDNQVGWARGLDTANYLGFDGWRLASVSVAAGTPTGTTTSAIYCQGATEEACRDNELGYMFYHNLGGELGDDLTGDHTVGDVTLTNIQSTYWPGTLYDPLGAYAFKFDGGIQHDGPWGPDIFYGWAVRSGDVGVIPIPATVWLFGSGLLGLIGISRRKKAA